MHKLGRVTKSSRFAERSNKCTPRAFSTDAGETWQPADEGRDRHYPWSVTLDTDDAPTMRRLDNSAPPPGGFLYPASAVG